MISQAKIAQKINYAENASITLNDRFTNLLLKLEQDLAVLERENREDNTAEKNEAEDSQEGFLDHHHKELEELKDISTLPVISISEIIWFLETAIFNLMSEVPETFSIEPLQLYACMLERVELSSKKVFREHWQVLLDKKTVEKANFPFICFFPVLSAARKKIVAEISSESNYFLAKRIKLSRGVSPLALPSNNLTSQIDDEHEGLQLRLRT